MWKLFGLVRLRRTPTGYYLGVTVVLAILNTIAWFVNAPRLYGLGVFSAGFLILLRHKFLRCDRAGIAV
jgi:hypothetical protein